MDLGIRGKTALLAGASVGMGMESALALAREGVNLFISARGEERLRATATSIAKETGVEVTPVTGDHGTSEGRAALLKACPNPDILVITCSPPRFLEGYTDPTAEEWMNALSTTFVGPLELMRQTVPGMVERRFGRVVNIGTIAAKKPNEVRLLSGAPRAALCNYTSAISKRAAAFNVSINNILPGMFHTASMKEKFDAMARENGTTYEIETEKWIAALGNPSRRFGEPEDIGAFCAMLCSRYASYMTGQSVVIDGGQVYSTF